MKDILSQVSSVIIAGIGIEDQHLLNGIKNLTNRSFVYPKSRFLQIILDPKIITKDTNIFINSENIKFLSIRKKLIEDLSSKLGLKESGLLLKAFVNDLLDNSSTINFSNPENILKGKENKSLFTRKVKALYDKCEEVGLPYGYLNIYQATLIKKIISSKYKIPEIIDKYIKTSENFKKIFILLTTNFKQTVNRLRVIDLISKTEESDIDFLLSLPNPVVEVLTDGIGFYSISNNLTFDRIAILLEIYNKQPMIFKNLVDNPLLVKLFMTHSNFDIMNEFLQIIDFNRKKIAEIESFNRSITAFILSYVTNLSVGEDEDIRALIELSKIDLKKGKLIISNAPIIKKTNVKLKILCEVAIDNSELFNLLIKRHENNLELLEHVCRKNDISDTNQMIDIIKNKPYQEVRELFDIIHEEYEK